MNPSKLLPPRQASVLDRERLLNRLLLMEDRKLIIIHAQAGQGKSTLAVRYVQSLEIPFLWYNMDPEDDDPGVFLSCFGRAFQSVFPDLLPRLPLLPPAARGMVDMRATCRQWVKKVFLTVLKPCFIVFEDLNNTSSSPALLFILKTLIEETPPYVRFMIVSRIRPDLELAGLRAKRGIGEITAKDLKFTDAEAADLFNSVFGMQLTEKDAVSINRNAEGWPAGLVLVHEYLSSSPDSKRTDFIARGQNEFRDQVFDYLAQEVFSQLPARLQQFLLSTSITDYLPFPLMQRLGNIPAEECSRMVAELMKRNLFLTVLNDAPIVIRYHSLFRDFLNKRLRSTRKPSELGKLYSLASQFFDDAGDQSRAVDLLLCSGRSGHAVRKIESYVPLLIAQGRTQTILRWQQELPPSDRDRPWFLLSKAVSCRFSDPRTALVLFDRALKRFLGRSAMHEQVSGQMLCLCGIIEACFHSGGDFKRMGRTALLAQAVLKRNKRESHSPTRARLLLAIGMAWFFTGSLQKSREALTQALDLFRNLHDAFHQITCSIYLAPCALYQGDFRLARDAVKRGLEAHAAIPDEIGGKAALLLTSAMTELFQGNFLEAQHSIDQCKKLADVHALESIAFLSLDIEGWLKIAQGDYDGAVALLKECKRKGVASRNAFFSASATHLLAIAYLFQNKLGKAKIESDFALDVPEQSRSRLFHAIYLIAGGAILLKIGNFHSAEKILKMAVKTLRLLKASQQEANAHLVLALLYERKKNSDLLRKHLQLAFCIGQELEFRYYALLTQEELTALARKAISYTICTDYCMSLLSERPTGASRPLLKIECLGGFKVLREGKPVKDVEWKSKRAKAFLKLLVAYDGQKLPREHAIEMLWPKQESENLRSSFNSMLCRLRKVLETGLKPGKDIFCIQHEGDVISLNRDRVSTDMHEFLWHLERAAKLKSAQQPIDVLNEYEKALELYRGDFLPEDLYNDWTINTRERLRTQYLRLLGDAGRVADSAGETSRAQQFYERMFLTDPSNEKACRWLMTRYLAMGQRNEAIRSYERCERALSRDMDMEPDEKTKKLYRSIIGGNEHQI